MSLHEEQIQLFIHLFRTKPELFKQYREELSQLINQAPDDAKALSGKIMDWCGEHIEIDKALAEFSKVLNRGAGGKELNEEIPDYRPFKETLKNSIQQSYSGDDKKDNKND